MKKNLIALFCISTLLLGVVLVFSYDKNQLAILKSGVDKWNTWRKSNPNVEINLTNSDFTMAKLGGVNLSNAILCNSDFTGANLVNSDLSGANLINVNLMDADLNNVTLTNADLINVILDKKWKDMIKKSGAKNIDRIKWYDSSNKAKIVEELKRAKERAKEREKEMEKYKK